MNKNERTKVLIVENVPHVIKQLEKLLNLMDNVEVVGEMSTGQDAVDYIRVARPEVALVGTNLPDINGMKLTEMIRRDFPTTQVVVISQDKFFDNAVRALRDGASDYLTHDVTLEELSVAINRASGLAEVEKEKLISLQVMDSIGVAPPKEKASGGDGKIITVYSPKGGAGVTTLAINLALSLQDNETSIALVDGSVQFGDVAISLNEVSKFSMIDLVPRVYELDKKVIYDTMVLHKSSGLHLLSAPPRPELAEKITGNNFMKVLEFMRSMFHYVIVNTSSYISDPCLAALDAADVVVLVTIQEIAAIRNTRSFLELWDELGLNKDRILLVLNHYDKQEPITPEKVGDRLKMPVAIIVPEDEPMVSRGSNLGIPFMLENKDTPVQKSMQSLAESVRKKLGQMQGESRLRLFSQS